MQSTDPIRIGALKKNKPAGICLRISRSKFTYPSPNQVQHHLRDSPDLSKLLLSFVYPWRSFHHGYHPVSDITYKVSGSICWQSTARELCSNPQSGLLLILAFYQITKEFDRSKVLACGRSGSKSLELHMYNLLIAILYIEQRSRL